MTTEETKSSRSLRYTPQEGNPSIMGLRIKQNSKFHFYHDVKLHSQSQFLKYHNCYFDSRIIFMSYSQAHLNYSQGHFHFNSDDSLSLNFTHYPPLCVWGGRGVYVCYYAHLCAYKHIGQRSTSGIHPKKPHPPPLTQCLLFFLKSQ